MKSPTAFARTSAMVALLLILASIARADPAADAKAVTDEFSKAFAACDVPAILAMYEDDATVIWPGQGEFATGKTEIEKVIKENCGGNQKHALTEVSSFARAVSKDYIMHYGQLDDTAMGREGKPMTLRIRVSELLHKSGGKWRYVIDHASAGLPPPAEAGGATTR